MILRSRLDSAGPLYALRPHTIGRRSVLHCVQCTAERGERLNALRCPGVDAHLLSTWAVSKPRTMLLLIIEGAHQVCLLRSLAEI